MIEALSNQSPFATSNMLTGANGLEATTAGNQSYVFGPPQPKDSIVNTPSGTYAFACVEGTRPWFIDIVPVGTPTPQKFFDATSTAETRFLSSCGKFELVFAVRQGLSEWNMPEKTQEQMEAANSFWSQAG